MTWKLWQDLMGLNVASSTVVKPLDWRLALRTAGLDAFHILALNRGRELARRYRIRGLNRTIRLSQIALFGVEIGNEVTLGEGVYFVHSLGIIIGGDAIIGDRVKFMGNNTVGTAKDNGYPVIGNDVMVGAGARILGPVHIGDGAQIGANAVVLCDVPAGAVAIGVPARVVKPKTKGRK